MTVRNTADMAAVVNTDHKWIDIEDEAPPKYGKMLLINRYSGIAVVGQYAPGYGYTHWQGLPTFGEKRED